MFKLCIDFIHKDDRIKLLTTNPSSNKEDINMKKIQKNKKGFTLIEMVLVIAIILILASVLVISISTYIQSAKTAASSVGSHNSEILSASIEISKALA